MIDLAALSLPTAAPGLMAAPLQNGGNAAEAAESAAVSPGIAFDALLALQIAPAEPADAPLPECGKILPDPAKLLAALPPVRVADVQARPQPAKAAAKSEAPDEEFENAPELRDAALPDPALIAALFAAPDRPVPTDTADAGTSPEAPRATHAPAASAPAAPQSPAHAAIALARTAQIELAPASEGAAVASQPEAAAAVPTAQIMAARQVRQSKQTGAANAELPEPAARPAPAGDPKQLADREIAEMPRVEAPSTTTMLADRSIATPDTSAPAPLRHEARSERIDFATLVDTLARAREEASPRAITASVNHAEFGRVSLRFDHDEDRGMSVAMSSADPGFARAVSATTEAARTPTESTGQNPQGQPQAQAQAGQGESQRQQPRQAEHTPTRPFANSGSPLRDDEAPRPRTDDRGIYA
ncbi:hypothetical protein [Novosphingobium jiangmenense]|uniref:Flagellar hook-length control protein FliK n=1 Tax=Novosphingobium jiangmenense TaxID=2791981 RepID=A0ABS0HJ18_9SPHN|nr:hypothetical protein [Novosphingobium jiangmenense]MBF9152004.1 hypothetical protein [Novosphingobium jiangmenense]